MSVNIQQDFKKQVARALGGEEKKSATGSALNPTRHFLLKHIGFDKIIHRAKSSTLVDEHGSEYLDFISQYGALPFGHNVDFLKDRVAKFFDNHEATLVQPLIAPEAERLAERLIALSSLSDGYCTFCNSGAEAVEIAIKLARSHTGRQGILSSKKGFHGKTLGAGSATGNPNYSRPFLPDTKEFKHIDLDDLEIVREALEDKSCAAVIVELVQGEGGMHSLSKDTLLGLSDLCKEFGTLLVVDEVQTGIGRLGAVFGLEHYPGVDADIICLAKALGGGVVPLGAVLCKKSTWSEEFGLYHSSTFANNNLACALGNVVIDSLQSNDQALLKHVMSVSKYLRARLEELVRRYPLAYKGVNGAGLMLGVELTDWLETHSYFLAHANFHGLAVPLVCGYLLNEHKILTAPVFNHNGVVRIEPNLNVTLTCIDRLIHALDDTGRLISERKFSTLFSYVVGLPVSEASYSEDVLSLDPVMPMPSESGKCLGSFAFFIHPTMDDDLVRIMPESISGLSGEHINKWRNWMASWFSERYEPAPVLHAPAVINSQGDYVEGWLISCPLTPEKMMRLRKKKRERLVKQYFEIAESLGVDRVGLGAFTSIITRGGSVLPQRDVAITTGNSYTGLVSGKELVNSVLKHRGRYENLSLAVVGAGGAVARIAAIEASRAFSRITLFGNPSNPAALTGLEDVRAEIIWRAIEDEIEGVSNALARRLKELTKYSIKFDAEGLLEILNGENQQDYQHLTRYLEQKWPGVVSECIVLSVSLEADLPSCSAVISATSNGSGFIDSNLLAPAAVVCDAARPPDFSKSLKKDRPDVYAFEGGIVRLPHPIAFGKSNILGFEPEVNLACLSETIVLTMAGVKEDFSVGKELDIKKAREMYEYAEQYGFQPFSRNEENSAADNEGHIKEVLMVEG